MNSTCRLTRVLRGAEQHPRGRRHGGVVFVTSDLHGMYWHVPALHGFACARRICEIGSGAGSLVQCASLCGRNVVEVNRPAPKSGGEGA